MRARKQTLKFRNRPYIISAYAIGGKKEGEGPLHDWFDECLSDDTYGENTWEKSESRMLKTAMTECMRRGGKTTEEIGAVLSGDLLNQLMSSSFMARDLQIPFLGMYGACSTMTESLMLGAVLTDGGYSDNVMIGASSHYCTAERQFRLPLEYGNPFFAVKRRPPVSAAALVFKKVLFDFCRFRAGHLPQFPAFFSCTFVAIPIRTHFMLPPYFPKSRTIR